MENEEQNSDMSLGMFLLLGFCILMFGLISIFSIVIVLFVAYMYLSKEPEMDQFTFHYHLDVSDPAILEEKDQSAISVVEKIVADMLDISTYDDIDIEVRYVSSSDETMRFKVTLCGTKHMMDFCKIREKLKEEGLRFKHIVLD